MKRAGVAFLFVLLFLGFRSLQARPGFSGGCGVRTEANGLSSGVKAGLSQLLYDRAYMPLGNQEYSPIRVQYFSDLIVVNLKEGIKAKKVVFTALNMEGFELYVDERTQPPFMTAWTQRNSDSFLITGIKAEIYPEKGNPIKVGYNVDQRAVEDTYLSYWADWGFHYTPFCN